MLSDVLVDNVLLYSHQDQNKRMCCYRCSWGEMVC